MNSKSFVFTRCPHDGMSLVLPEANAGQRIECHFCGGEFVAPTHLFGEAEWRDCQEIEKAITCLHALEAYPNQRKIRLLTCGVCRLEWQHLNGRCRQALQVAERFADGLAEDDEREAAFLDVSRYVQELHRLPVTFRQQWARRLCDVLAFYVHVRGDLLRSPDQLQTGNECVLLREVVGNPFRKVILDPQWLDGNDGTVTKLAETIYQERTFDCMPILADALEDAGCTEPTLLNHCRVETKHIRGCWVVDLILAKNESNRALLQGPNP